MAEGACGAGLARALPEEFAGHVGGVCRGELRVSIGSIEFRTKSYENTECFVSHTIKRKEDVL